MGVMTNYLKQKLLDNATGVSAYTAPTLYVGFSTTTPTAAGTNITEPVGNGYARIELTSNMGDAVNGAIFSVSAISTPQSTGSWGTLTHSVLFNASTAGIALYFDDLTTSRTVETGTTITIAASALSIRLND